MITVGHNHKGEAIVIDADKYQFIVGTLKYRTDKAGTETSYIANPSYCGTQMSHALQTVLKILMLDAVESGYVTSIEAYINELKAQREDLEKSLSALQAVEFIAVQASSALRTTSDKQEGGE